MNGDFISEEVSTHQCVFGKTPEQVRAILAEEGHRYPFRNHPDLGEGPRHGKLKKAGKWDCDNCSKERCKKPGCQTACDCVGIGSNEGHEKHVEIKKKYKDKYDKEYKQWSKEDGHPVWRARRAKRSKK